jgi:hypothetical protein
VPTPLEALENALADLRWHSNEITAEAYEACLTLVANYPEFLLLVTGDGMPMAPDNRGRKLAPVFTNPASYEAFREEVLSEGKLIQPLLTKISGAELFPKLHTMQLDGMVFDCCGPERPLAFVPQTIPLLVERIGKPVAEAPVVDFIRLAARAFPDQQQGARQDLDALWQATLDLDEWHFFVHPDQASKDPYPFIAPQDGKRCGFVFTSIGLAQKFAFANEFVKEENSGVLCISMPLPGAIDWIERAGASGELERVHFNFGMPGWFSPPEQLKPICHHLKRFNFS